ncbi:MAG TPA: ubiquinol-cytochrome C chaperone family protein [Sphingomicrobium sp.]|nr:ubiquinol-cytochrome C chaperone family protein [Sphingomicrobium sp.]
MFRALFARLTGEPKRGQGLFELALAEAGRTDWFIAGEVPDTVNGRFAILGTIIALIAVRLEKDGEQGARASVALTERLVETLDTEIREMGVGDPTLGKQVRKLVGSVGGRVERWREQVKEAGSWTGEVERSLYLGEPPSADAVAYGESALRAFWKQLGDLEVDQLAKGRAG